MIDHDSNLFIVGMMGAGKSAVGRALANRLCRPFVDVDGEIERRTGVAVATIFEIEGEAGFRRREEQVIDECSAPGRRLVLSTGGGAVLSAVTRARLRERGFTIYLQARPHDLWLRTRHDRNRPLLACADPERRLEELLAVRDPLYREVAHLVVETGRPSVARLVDALVARLTTPIAAPAAEARMPAATR